MGCSVRFAGNPGRTKEGLTGQYCGGRAKSQRKTRRVEAAGIRCCDRFSLSLSEGNRTMESDLENRSRERNAKISRNYGTMLVRALRERYGKNFAAGHADTLTLREVINRLDAPSLNRLQGDLEKVQLDEPFRPGPSRG